MAVKHSIGQRRSIRHLVIEVFARRPHGILNPTLEHPPPWAGRRGACMCATPAGYRLPGNIGLQNFRDARASSERKSARSPLLNFRDGARNFFWGWQRHGRQHSFVRIADIAHNLPNGSGLRGVCHRRDPTLARLGPQDLGLCAEPSNPQRQIWIGLAASSLPPICSPSALPRPVSVCARQGQARPKSN